MQRHSLVKAILCAAIFTVTPGCTGGDDHSEGYAPPPVPTDEVADDEATTTETSPDSADDTYLEISNDDLWESPCDVFTRDVAQSINEAYVTSTDVQGNCTWSSPKPGGLGSPDETDGFLSVTFWPRANVDISDALRDEPPGPVDSKTLKANFARVEDAIVEDGGTEADFAVIDGVGEAAVWRRFHGPKGLGDPYLQVLVAVRRDFSKGSSPGLLNLRQTHGFDLEFDSSSCNQTECEPPADEVQRAIAATRTIADRIEQRIADYEAAHR